MVKIIAVLAAVSFLVLLLGVFFNLTETQKLIVYLLVYMVAFIRFPEEV